MNGDILTPKPTEPKVEPEKVELLPDKPVVEEVKAEEKVDESSAAKAMEDRPFKVGQAYDPNAEKKPKFLETFTPPEPGVITKLAKDQKPKRSKKKKLLITLIVLIVLACGGFAGWYFGFNDSGQPKAVTNQSTTDEEVIVETDKKSDLVASPLSGVLVPAADAARPVTGIMIENSGNARPQSGLREADVVFEAIAEGGITRFLALFQTKKPDYIGPVRSARPYYVEWAAAFDAGYAHAGGSPDGIARISQLGVKDINAFAYGSDVFFRTSDRESPHNLYSSFAGLDKVNSDNGNTSSIFTAWERKEDTPQTALAKSIDIVISSSFYNVHYDYDAATNTYLRSEGGSKHLDEKSGQQLAPDNVLVMVMDNRISGQYNVYTTTGSGAFVSFQDGVVREGTWSRTGAKDQYTFKDKYGFDFLFNRGQTWVSIIDTRSDVSYVP
jgi:hypothetical protein